MNPSMGIDTWPSSGSMQTSEAFEVPGWSVKIYFRTPTPTPNTKSLTLESNSKGSRKRSYTWALGNCLCYQGRHLNPFWNDRARSASYLQRLSQPAGHPRLHSNRYVTVRPKPSAPYASSVQCYFPSPVDFSFACILSDQTVLR